MTEQTRTGASKQRKTGSRKASGLKTGRVCLNLVYPAWAAFKAPG